MVEGSSKVFTPQSLRALVVELRQQSSDFERLRQSRIEAFSREISDVERRLRRLYELVAADAGLELSDVAPRIRDLKARLETLKRAAVAVAEEKGPEVTCADEDVWEAARMLREVDQTSDNPAKLRQFMERLVKRATVKDDEIAVDYWPESIVQAVGGSQCAVRWLPDLGSNQGHTD